VSNPIDKAIAATQTPTMPRMAEVPVMINSTGRPSIVVVPEDITDAEVMELTAWLLRSLRGHIAANLSPASGLVIARGRVDA
jgi:hypothetical protein